MLPRCTPLQLLISAVVGIAAVHACIMLGGTLRVAAIWFCAFALLIGGPIAILAWLGSASDLEQKDKARRRELRRQESEALLWRRTMMELEASTNSPPHAAPTTHIISDDTQGRFAVPPPALASVASASGRHSSRGGRARRSILGHCLAVASTMSLVGCDTLPPPEAWMSVQPGMGTTELVALVGGPNYVRSNGPVEVWQYCRDFRGRDEGRNARYYTAVLVEGDVVRDIRPYAVYSNAGCKDFYRAEF